MTFTLFPASDPAYPLRVGCGAGFSGDRWDAAVAVVETLVQSGQPSVLMFETLAERTLALAQLQRRADPDKGYEPTLDNFIRPVLRRCVDHGIPIVGNFGAANPRCAAARMQALAVAMNLPPLRIAVIEGDDLGPALQDPTIAPCLPDAAQGQTLVSANVYLGAREIANALLAGAQIVVTGRVADPALALGPMMAYFGWADDDWHALACGTMAGHLLECGAQVCGGYFADPGLKDVPGLAQVGFPIVEMQADGSFVVTKAANTGGVVDERTVKEQLLYELHDPTQYLTPDVVADISDAQVERIAANRVRVTGVRGHPRPATLKATVCFEGGWLSEGEISYAGPNAVARAQLAAQVVRERLQGLGLATLPCRYDLIGVSSVLGSDGTFTEDHFERLDSVPEVRLRVAARTATRTEAEAINREVLALYTCGPAGGGGVRTHITPRLNSSSAYIPREHVHATWSFV